MSLPKYNRFEKKPRVRTFTGDPRKQTRKPSSGPPRPSKPRRLRPNFNSPRFDIAKKKKKKKNA